MRHWNWRSIYICLNIKCYESGIDLKQVKNTKLKFRGFRYFRDCYKLEMKLVFRVYFLCFIVLDKPTFEARNRSQGHGCQLAAHKIYAN